MNDNPIQDLLAAMDAITKPVRSATLPWSHYRSGFVDGAKWQASRKVEVTKVEDLNKYPDGSVFLNSRGHVVVLNTVQFAPEEPVRVFFSIAGEEDWPLDRLGFPAQLLHRPTTPTKGTP